MRLGIMLAPPQAWNNGERGRMKAAIWYWLSKKYWAITVIGWVSPYFFGAPPENSRTSFRGMPTEMWALDLTQKIMKFWALYSFIQIKWWKNHRNSLQKPHLLIVKEIPFSFSLLLFFPIVFTLILLISPSFRC